MRSARNVSAALGHCLLTPRIRGVAVASQHQWAETGTCEEHQSRSGDLPEGGGERMGRVPCCDKDSVKRGPWTPEEDNKLLSYITQHGTRNWRLIPKNAGLQRCWRSCRLRWTNYLRPDLKHGEFTDAEEQTIIKLHSVMGSRWSLIAAQLPGRTDNDVRNHWNTKLKKQLSGMGIDPVTHKSFSDLMATLAPPQVAVINAPGTPPQVAVSNARQQRPWNAAAGGRPASVGLAPRHQERSGQCERVSRRRNQEGYGRTSATASQVRKPPDQLMAYNASTASQVRKQSFWLSNPKAWMLLFLSREHSC